MGEFWLVNLKFNIVFQIYSTLSNTPNSAVLPSNQSDCWFKNCRCALPRLWLTCHFFQILNITVLWPDFAFHTPPSVVMERWSAACLWSPAVCLWLKPLSVPLTLWVKFSVNSPPSVLLGHPQSSGPLPSQIWKGKAWEISSCVWCRVDTWGAVSDRNNLVYCDHPTPMNDPNEWPQWLTPMIDRNDVALQNAPAFQ